MNVWTMTEIVLRDERDYAELALEAMTEERVWWLRLVITGARIAEARRAS